MIGGTCQARDAQVTLQRNDLRLARPAGQAEPACKQASFITR